MAESETIADIIAEKRRDAQHIRNNLSTVPVRRLDQLAEIKSLADEADRIEAAHKRERENYDAKIADLQLRVKLWTDRSDELVKKCVEQYAKLNQVGNSAKLREVVRKLLDALYDMGIDENTLAIAVESPNCQMKSEHTLSVFKEARAALAAPPRNCDIVPIEAQEAADMFHRERPCHGYCYETHEWLLAPATEKEGGNDADK